MIFFDVNRNAAVKNTVEMTILQDSAVNYWIEKGFPARKIVLGLPIYGRSFTLKDPKQNGIGAPTRDGGQAGVWTRAKGFLGYYEVR